MIRIENLTKSFPLRRGRKMVIDDLTATLPSGRSMGLMGLNGAGKSTLLRLIAGTLRPDSGTIASDGSISWPVGFGGSFHAELTGAQNVRFIARIYGVDTDKLCDFVAGFAEIGRHFHMPVRTYSAGMKSRLAFGASMGIRFDTYLVDEVTAVGDAAFREKSRLYFLDRVRNASAIMVSHDMAQLRAFCDAGVVLTAGRLTYFDDISDAIEVHLETIARGAA